MSVLDKRIPRDAGDAVVLITGSVKEGDSLDERIVAKSDFKDQEHFISLRLTEVFYSIQDGLTVLLFWENEDEHNLLMPLEGRGLLKLESFGGIPDPRVEGFTSGIVLRTEAFKPGRKHFTLALEFAKQRS